MLVIGLVLSMFGIGLLCWLIFTFAVYTLPFLALCGRPHKASYVASRDMWRTNRLTFFIEQNLRIVRHISGEAIGRAGTP
jgi:hypothetical protein